MIRSPLATLGCCLGWTFALITVATATAPHPGDELLCAGGNEMFIAGFSAEQGSVVRSWRWSGDDCEGLEKNERPWFHHLDECRLIEGRSKILVTASNSGCALVDRPSGKVLWRASVTNAHSIELLPYNRVVVASSLSGDQLVLFDLGRSYEPLAKTPLRSAHGVIWDGPRERLWALGFDELRSYKLKDWETRNPSLSLEATYRLPDDDGHDLRAIPESPDLILSTEKSVWLFDRKQHTFRSHPLIGQYAGVKSLDVHPTIGRIIVGRWGTEAELVSPAGKISFSPNRPYKIRWTAQ
jgi:hypothetical protein